MVDSHYEQPAPFYDFAQPTAKMQEQQGPVEIHEAPSTDPGWGPGGRYEAGSKTPGPVEM